MIFDKQKDDNIKQSIDVIIEGTAIKQERKNDNTSMNIVQTIEGKEKGSCLQIKKYLKEEEDDWIFENISVREQRRESRRESRLIREFSKCGYIGSIKLKVNHGSPSKIVKYNVFEEDVLNIPLAFQQQLTTHTIDDDVQTDQEQFEMA